MENLTADKSGGMISALSNLSIAGLVLVGGYNLLQPVAKAHIEYLSKTVSMIETQTRSFEKQVDALHAIEKSSAETSAMLAEILENVEYNRRVLSEGK